MSHTKKDAKKLKITFINPNSNQELEALLKLVMIEKIKSTHQSSGGGAKHENSGLLPCIHRQGRAIG
jgi:hypothetical protein